MPVSKFPVDADPRGMRRPKLSFHNLRLILILTVAVSMTGVGVWQFSHAVSSPSVPRVGTGGAIGPCSWFVSLDGTTPVAEAMVGGLSVNPGDNVVGTPGQDMGAYLNALVAGNEAVCFSGQAFSFSTSFNPISNLAIRCMPGTSFKLAATQNIMINTGATGSTVTNFLVDGCTFDLTSHNSQAIILQGSDATGQVSNITIRNSQFKNPGSVWMLHFNYLWTDPAIPTLKHQNIQILNNLFNGTGFSSSFENVLITNAQNVLVQGNTFANNPSPSSGSLGIYAYCRDVRVIGNDFVGYSATQAFYTNNSDNVIVSGNTFRSTSDVNAIEVLNSRNTVLSSNTFSGKATGTSGFGIIIQDAAGTFDGHTDLYPQSSNVTISSNSFTGFAYSVYLFDGSMQGQNDIFVTGNQAMPFRSFFFTAGMPNAPSSTVKHIFITGNEVSNYTSAGILQAAITIAGNSHAPNGGFQDIAITDNFIGHGSLTRSAINIEQLADNVTIQGNTVYDPITVTTNATNVRTLYNTGYNPVGQAANFINAASTSIGTCGTGTSIVSTTEYTVCRTDITWLCTGGTVTNITEEDNLDNTIWSVANCAALPATGVYTPIGYAISFTETGAPTITVFAD